MERTIRLVSLVAIALLTGCSSGTPPTPDPSPSSGPAGQAAATLATDDGGAGTGNHSGGDARDAGHNPDPGAFGAACASGSDCESNVCFLGGKGGVCSVACTSDTDCPPGADGTQHCNPKGYCRY